MSICFCGAPTRSAAFHDQFFGRPLRLCTACRSLLIEQVPSAEQLEIFYTGAYSEDRKSFVDEAYMAVMRHRATAQTRFIARHIDLDGARILDHGCGYGMLLDALRDAGARVAGFDHDPLCREALMQKGHILADADPLAGRQDWDLVCFSHVVEHLPDPAGLLSALKARAAHLFIEVPRYEATRPEAFVDQEGHLWFFTPHGAEGLVANSGWDVLETTAAGPALDLYWADGVAARLRRRLRRRTSKDWFFGQYDRQDDDGMWIRIMAKRPL